MSIMLKRIICLAALGATRRERAGLSVAPHHGGRTVPRRRPERRRRAHRDRRDGKILGQSMIIENIGGAGGTIGSARGAAANPDGYTLLAGSMGAHVASPALTPHVKYDSD